MTDLKQEFGRKLKEIREDRGYTQEGLAEAVESTRDTIRNIETGRHGPRFGLFEKILKALEAHPRDFFDFSWSTRKRKKK